MSINKDNVKALALRNGFELKEQPDGRMDLNPYVYTFAQAILDSSQSYQSEAIHEIYEQVLDRDNWRTMDEVHFSRGYIGGMCVGQNLEMDEKIPCENKRQKNRYAAEIIEIKSFSGEVSLKMLDDGEVPPDVTTGSVVSLRPKV
jgi:hypothetical protein